MILTGDGQTKIRCQYEEIIAESAPVTVNSPWTYGIKLVDSEKFVGDYSSIAVDGNKIYISYYDGTNGDLKFAKSIDGGHSWPAGNIVTVDAGTDNADVGKFTSIAASGSNIYISYFDETNNDLMFAKSTDGGSSWESPNGFVTTVDSSSVFGQTSIAVSGNYVYIYYFRSSNAMFAISDDGGATWPTTKTAGPGGSVRGSLAVDGDNMYVSYYDNSIQNDIKFNKSTDSGVTWPSGTVRDIYTSPLTAAAPNSIAADGQNIYISYHIGSGTNTIYVIKSTDWGDTWPAENIKSIDSSGQPGYTANSILAAGDNVYLVYPSNSALRFAKSTDGGVTWPSANKKDIENFRGEHPSFAVDGTNVYVSYYDNYYNLRFAKSIDSGTTW